MPLEARRTLTVISALALGLLFLPADAVSAPADGADDRGAGRYIVVLDRGDPGAVAEEHRRDHGAEVRHVYRTALRGYAAQLSPQAAERIAADDRVAYVEADREVAIVHHACGHTGGPPGSSPDDGCEDGTVTGTITDAETGEGIDGAEVVIDENDDWTATTDSDGTYLIEDVDGGAERTIVASADGYEDVSDTIMVDGDTEWSAQLEPTDPDGADPETHTVSGAVTETDTDEPIEGASVTLEGDETHAATTDENGEYTLDEVAEGDYTATADADGYEETSEDITVDEDTIWSPELKPADEEDEAGEAEVTPWGVKRTGATDAHAAGHVGDGVSVYILDTGIDPLHVDLTANIADDWDNDHVAIVSCRGGQCETDWDDRHGHGTHVAGTAAASDGDQLLGVAPEATLHAVKVLDDNGRGWQSDIIAGIDWVAEHVGETDNGPAVANMSLGGSGSKDGECTEDNGFVGEDGYHEAICNATHAGVVFAVAAGNSGTDAADTVPAAYDDAVITVSATRCDLGGEHGQTCEPGTDAFADFSNYGDPVAIAAPGVDVLSAWPGDDTHEGSGTSMAAPHVAGAVALLIGDEKVAEADYTAFATAGELLVDTAEDTDGWPKDGDEDHEHDEGFLDVAAALDLE